MLAGRLSQELAKVVVAAQIACRDLGFNRMAGQESTDVWTIPLCKRSTSELGCLPNY